METLVTGREVMAFLRISRATLYRFMDRGLPSLGQGRLRRFEREAVREWVETAGAEAEPPVVLYQCRGCGVRIEDSNPEPLQACPRCRSRKVRVMGGKTR